MTSFGAARVIQLRTLGALSLRDDAGHDVKAVLAQPKRLGLLIYLAAARPTAAHRRDTVLARFWPEMEDARARDALNQSLRFLRHALGPDIFVRHAADDVGVDRGRLWSDVAAFRDALDAGRPDDAMALYQGDLLDGFFVDGASGFEEWLDRERTALRDLASRASRELAERAEAANELPSAMAWATRAMELAPDDERALRQLLTLHERVGDRIGGIRTYDRFVSRLRAEYDCAPSPETRAVAERLRARAVATPPGAALPPNAFTSDANDGESPIVAATAPPRRAASGRRPNAFWYSLAIVVSLATVAWWGRRDPEGEDAPAVRSEVRLPRNATLAPVAGSPMAIAVEGRFIAFTGERDGVRRLFVQGAGELDPHEIPGTETARSPFFSPDGRRIAFFAGGALLTVSAEGGPVTRFAEVPATVEGGRWLPSGDIVVSIEGRLAMASPSGTVRPFSAPDSARGETRQILPVALSDGATVLYRSESGNEAGRIGVVSLADGSTTILDVPARTSPLVGAGGYPLGTIDDYIVYLDSVSVRAVRVDLERRRVVGSPVTLLGGVTAAYLSPDGSLIYSRTRQRQQVVLATPGRASQVILGEPRRYLWPRLSPDGKRLALTIGDGPRNDIWVYDMPSGPLVRITTDGVLNRRVEWTPDGRNLIYVSDRGPKNALWIQPADGSGSARIFFSLPDAEVNEGILSNDGEVLVYQRDATGAGELWHRRMHGDTTPRPIERTGAAELSPRLSPDGKWLAYQSFEGDRYEVYVRPFPSLDARHRVSVDGGVTPVWSRDGRRLVYVKDRTLVAASIATSPGFAVTAREQIIDGEYEFLIVHPDFDVMPNGAALVVPRPVANAWWPVVVRNWRREVRERVRSAVK
jgi:Tol biopolymer transport system component/DNA-binding SARP family transcriptional activator